MPVTWTDTPLSEQLVVSVGNADGPPETFSIPATINADRALEMTADAKAVTVPQAGNAGVMKTMRHVVSTDTKITGAGALDKADAKKWADWLLSGAAKNCQIADARTGGLVLTGSFVLTQFTLTGSQQGELVTAQITLEQADLPVSTAHA